ncbi:MAG TPA: TIGR01458 family HAD-type hydrolase [Methanoregulaceae archaeon]|nr:TIGR01458 family HAD-type hydrolase [Methanoregulaceae archaeon]
MKARGILIDLDGVMYTGDRVIPGAPEAIRYLEGRGYLIRYLSNTTRKSRETIRKRLSQFGFSIGANEIFTPATAAIGFLSKAEHNSCHFLVTGDVSDEFDEAGYYHRDCDVDFVVIGDAGDNFNYSTMTRAFRLVREGAGIIALEKDRYWMGNDGLMLSAGPFVKALEYATGETAVLMGKPSPQYFHMALASIGVRPGDAVMIGDDVVSDIGGAIRSGLQGVLVKTGKYDEHAASTAEPKPEMVIDSIASVRDFL